MKNNNDKFRVLIESTTSDNKLSMDGVNFGMTILGKNSDDSEFNSTIFGCLSEDDIMSMLLCSIETILELRNKFDCQWEYLNDKFALRKLFDYVLDDIFDDSNDSKDISIDFNGLLEQYLESLDNNDD